MAWLVADWPQQGLVDRSWVLAWNTLTLAGIFAVVAVTLAALKRNAENLEATVTQRTTKLREEIEERCRAEESLRQANAELQRTQLQLIEAAKMEVIGRMAAGVAHEVKNPLMTLSMGADYFLHRGSANADEATLLQDMKEAVEVQPRTIGVAMQKKRILVVDDEAGVTRSIKLNLEHLGAYEVCTENNARQALKTAREFKPDLILLDVMMPEMDGDTVAAQLRETAALKNTPIVFLTAVVSNKETKGQEAVIGGQNFLAKPVDLAELTRCIEEHLPR